jgi:septation ring formation regulator EzrA
MPFTISDFHDLVRILEERPEWREELRRLMLTDELLSLPEQVAGLRTTTDQRFRELTQQLTTLTKQVTELAEA